MQENLKLFATNKPDTFEEAVQVVFRVYDKVKDRVYLELDQDMNEFIRALVILFEAEELNEGDIIFLICLIDAIQTAVVEINYEYVNKNAVKLTLPLISILAKGGHQDIEIEVQKTATAH